MDCRSPGRPGGNRHMRVAVIGAGWAGLAAAVHLQGQGHAVTLLEGTRQLGGRARALEVAWPDGGTTVLDNGQHILIGAYTETLALMRRVGLVPEDLLLRLPLRLTFPDGRGLALPGWPTPLDVLAGLATARGWRLADKAALLRAALGWQWAGFRCDAATSVAELCRNLTPRVTQELVEPLCVSALNTPAAQASGQVFLRVLQDALFGLPGGSNLLLPRVDLGALLPDAAVRWLREQGAQVRLGARVQQLTPVAGGWHINGEAPAHDAVVLATSATDALHVLGGTQASADPALAQAITAWCRATAALRFEAITTVYVHAPGARLPHPMLALRAGQGEDATAPFPAQFVFDRGQLGGPAGVLAFVVSASRGERAALQDAVVRQARAQLGLVATPLQTVVDKRATFACTPGLVRPGGRIAPGLLACGDYVDGPYPATLEGAVRSALQLALPRA